MLKNVAAVLLNDVHPFELGVLSEVFGLDRSDDGLPVYDVAAVSAEGPTLPTHAGFTISTPYGLERLADADLIAISTGDSYPTREYPEELLAALRSAVDRGARVLSVCTGAFVLGAAGLLDGRRCTTHWRHVDDLAERFPGALVDENVLYVQDGTIVTGAGSAAGLDAALHLMRQQFGARTAANAARRMVVPPHRSGGQAQFIARQIPDCEAETLGPLLAWIIENLAEDLSVDELARRSHMSPRTFARRFRAETGTTPHTWVTGQRVQAAEELLELTDHSVDWIADEVGFGNAATLRHHFTRARGVSPQQYRRTFSGAAERAS
jgi:transcriptional regulator GlxA family with amidase domain